MTRIIQQNIIAGRFSYVNFIKARIHRIVPALLVMLAVTLTFSISILDPEASKSVARGALSSIFFISNFDYASQGGYFSGASQSNWLLHTWTLSVEWQFYLIYPIFLLCVGASDWGRRHLVSVMGSLAVLSWSLCGLVLLKNSDLLLRLTFYLLPARAFEMLLGGIVASAPWKIGPGSRMPLHLIGLACIVVSVFLFDDSVVWPGVAVLFPTIGAAAIIASGIASPRWAIFPPTVKLGKWSYSIYLWHWPIVAALYYYGISPSFISIVLGIIGSIVIGGISYVVVEQRLTKWLFAGAGAPVKILGLAGAILIVAASAFMTQGFERLRMPSDHATSETLKKIRMAERDWHYPSSCARYVRMASGLQVCKMGGDGPVAAIVIGDSYAQQLAPRYGGLPRGRNDPAIIFATKAACPPLPGVELEGSVSDCAASTEEALTFAIRGHYPRVLIAASWVGAMGSAPGHVKRGRICFKKGLICKNPADSESYNQLASDAFKQLGEDLNQMELGGSQVTILGVVPSSDPDKFGPADLYRTLFDNGHLATNQVFNPTLHPLYLSNKAYMDRLISIAASRSGARILDPAAFLCASGCPVVQDGAPVLFDDHHFRASSVKGPHFSFVDTVVGIVGKG